MGCVSCRLPELAWVEILARLGSLHPPAPPPSGAPLSTYFEGPASAQLGILGIIQLTAPFLCLGSGISGLGSPSRGGAHTAGAGSQAEVAQGQVCCFQSGQGTCRGGAGAHCRSWCFTTAPGALSCTSAGPEMAPGPRGPQLRCLDVVWRQCPALLGRGGPRAEFSVFVQAGASST